MNMKPYQKTLPEEKLYLNILNLSFKNNFLKLPAFVSSCDSYKKAWERLIAAKKINYDPLKEWERLEKNNINFITAKEKSYPSLLKEINNFPLGIYVKGEIQQENNFIAVVGTRKSSPYGELVTEKIVKELINYNFTIVSGLAYGIDAIAHKTALKSGGKTIAVLGSGLDRVLPEGNKNLAKEILLKKGGLISEYPLETEPKKYYFPWRNRIISGLCRATLIIEAPEKSGALITTRFALEQNREIFAIPGSIFNPNSLGPNNLIKEGAKLVSGIEDILEELNISFAKKENLEKNSDLEKQINNPLEKQIYQSLSPVEPLAIDKIVEKFNLKSNEVLACLTSLELKGATKDLGGGNYIKIN
ncbi:MAG: DNA-processing protein DprA [Candidatus Pacebacteria bacterium]|nr:DNA-processing protein DprA [Candidatus Paceibacterota bacterium]